MKKQFTLTTENEVDFSFMVTTAAYNQLINTSQKNLAASAIQFLQTTVLPEQKDSFNSFIDEHPAAPQQFAEILIGAFAPQVQVTLKN